jgi:hypothetical protein
VYCIARALWHVRFLCVLEVEVVVGVIGLGSRMVGLQMVKHSGSDHFRNLREEQRY